ncbi:MAG: hypothetical protein ACXWDJ_02445 [Aeromicrobium sp.]
MRIRAGAIAIIVMILVSVGGFAVSRTQPDARAPLSQALDVLPADTRVAGFTDWAQIRLALGFDDITTAIDRKTLVDNAFERDLSARSVLEDVTEDMKAKYGWSIADLRWEMYGQASDGALLAAGLNAGLEAGTVTSGLRDLGYAQNGDIWSIGTDDLLAKAPGFPSTFANIAFLDDERLILLSDNAAYLDRTLAMHRDHARSLAGVTAVRHTTTPLLGAHSAAIQVGKDACESAGLAGLTAAVRAQGRNTVKPLGKLEPVVYGARGIFDHDGDQWLRFSLTFDSAAQASHQLKLRRALSTGPFVGRNGQIGDVLTLTAGHTNGSNVTLDFDLDATKGSFMGGDGPLLFAACSS